MKNKLIEFLNLIDDYDEKLFFLTFMGTATEGNEVFELCEELRTEILESDSYLLWQSWVTAKLQTSKKKKVGKYE